MAASHEEQQHPVHLLLLTFSGQVVHERSVGLVSGDRGNRLEVSEIAGLAVSLGSFGNGAAAASKNATDAAEGSASGRNDPCVVTIKSQRFVFKDIGNLILVLSAHENAGNDATRRALAQVESMLVLILGPTEKWKRINLAGFGPMIDKCISSVLQDPTAMIGGMPYSQLSRDAVEHCDQVLSTLEQMESYMGSMLLICGTSSPSSAKHAAARTSVLHSRLSPEETKAVRLFCSLRPLEQRARLRITPIYAEGQWKLLVLVQMHWHVLAVTYQIDADLSQVMHRLKALELQLQEMLGNFNIPTEESLRLIEDYAGIETILFLFHNRETGMTICPELRQDPSKGLHAEVFLWFLRRAQDTRRESGMSEVFLAKGGYRFHASTQGKTDFYILCGAELAPEEVKIQARRVMTNLASSFPEIG